MSQNAVAAPQAAGSKPKVSPAEMAKAMAALQQGGPKNERGMPRVTFLPDVAEFLKENDIAIEILFENLNILLQKYRLMLKHVIQNRVTLQLKVPDLERTLLTVQTLMKKAEAEEELNSTFHLADGIWADATIKPETGTVFLWLGAEVLLEYPFKEAEELLKQQVDAAHAKLEEQSSDIMFLRDQITTTEVNVARCYNYDLAARKKAREEETANQAIQKEN